MSANKLDEAAAQAKSAFQDYRHRMSAGPYPYPPPMPAAPVAAAAAPATPALAESIGTLLRLGIDFLNAGLRTGTELMGTMAGTGAAPPHHMGAPEHHCCDHGHDHGHHCLYGNHCCDDCHPGVHNCC